MGVIKGGAEKAKDLAFVFEVLNSAREWGRKMRIKRKEEGVGFVPAPFPLPHVAVLGMMDGGQWIDLTR